MKIALNNKETGLLL